MFEFQTKRMTLRFIAILLFSFGCCTTTKPVFQDKIIESGKTDTARLLNPYYIRGISLIDSTYIIKASRNDSLFKIVSPIAEPLFMPPWLKKDLPPCDRLQEGKWYELEIHSIFESLDKIKRLRSSRIRAIWINGSTITYDEESHFDIYYTSNLRGLCYIRKDSLLLK